MKYLKWNDQGKRVLFLDAAAAKSLQSCLTLCDPIDGSPPSSPVPGILQVRTLEWVAIAFSNAWKWKVKVKLLSRVWLLGTPWTAAYQAPLSTGFSRQEYWSGVPLLSPFSSLEEIKDVIMCIPSGGTRTCHKSAQLFFDSSSLSPHPLPSLISNCWIRPLGLPW